MSDDEHRKLVLSLDNIGFEIRMLRELLERRLVK
jgi:hypothetical protein